MLAGATRRESALLSTAHDLTLSLHCSWLLEFNQLLL